MLCKIVHWWYCSNVSNNYWESCLQSLLGEVQGEEERICVWNITLHLACTVGLSHPKYFPCNHAMQFMVKVLGWALQIQYGCFEALYKKKQKYKPFPSCMLLIHTASQTDACFCTHFTIVEVHHLLVTNLRALVSLVILSIGCCVVHQTNALLHGHSFTAHPVGCVAACTAMDIMNDPKFNPNLVTRMDQEENHTQDQGPSPQPSCIPYLQQNPISGSLTPLWDDDLVIELSNHWKLQGVVAIGTVFAATLKPDEEEVTGYRSNRAREVTRRLRLRGVFARPLGDVVYLMVGVTTPRSVCTRLLTILKQELDVKTKG